MWLVSYRNLDYLFPHNPRSLYRLADSKLETKKIAQSIGVPVPETYGVVTFQIANREGLSGRLAAIDRTLAKLSGIQICTNKMQYLT